MLNVTVWQYFPGHIGLILKLHLFENRSSYFVTFQKLNLVGRLRR